MNSGIVSLTSRCPFALPIKVRWIEAAGIRWQAARGLTGPLHRHKLGSKGHHGVAVRLEYSCVLLPHDHFAANDFVGRLSPDHCGPGKLGSTLRALEISLCCIFYNALHEAFDKGAFAALNHISTCMLFTESWRSCM